MAPLDEILAALAHPVLILGAQGELVFINDHARHLLGLSQNSAHSLDLTLGKLYRQNGSPVIADDLDTPAPLPVRAHPDSALEKEYELRCRRLSDGSRCLELLPVTHHAGVPLDALTGLMERGQMLSLIGMKRQSGRGALILIDIDRLKIINDYLGYHTGDRVIHVDEFHREAAELDDVRGLDHVQLNAGRLDAFRYRRQSILPRFASRQNQENSKKKNKQRLNL